MVQLDWTRTGKLIREGDPQTGSVVDGTIHRAIQIFWMLWVVVAFTPYFIPAFAQTTNDPFPTPIAAVEGVINVDFVEFASIPDMDGQAARVMLLVDEPGTRRMFVNDMRPAVQRQLRRADRYPICRCQRRQLGHQHRVVR